MKDSYGCDFGFSLAYNGDESPMEFGMTYKDSEGTDVDVKKSGMPKDINIMVNDAAREVERQIMKTLYSPKPEPAKVEMSSTEAALRQEIAELRGQVEELKKKAQPNTVKNIEFDSKDKVKVEKTSKPEPQAQPKPKRKQLTDEEFIDTFLKIFGF